jgi:hypothetical protein
MFVQLETVDLMTIVVNTDHVVCFTLADAGWAPPYRPKVDVMFRGGAVVKDLWIPTVDQPDQKTAPLAVWRFIHEVLGVTP